MLLTIDWMALLAGAVIILGAGTAATMVVGMATRPHERKEPKRPPPPRPDISTVRDRPGVITK
jgi:hypothetical protein